MKFILLLLSTLAFSTAFTVSSYTGRCATTVRSFGTPTKSRIERTIEKDVADADQADDAVSTVGSVLEASSTKEIAEVMKEEEQDEVKMMMQQVKDSGVAGVISYALWELGFWCFSVPVCVFGYREVTGHWPDLQNQDDIQKLGAEAFAFVNFARFAVPLRIGLALGTTPWIQENIVDKFSKQDGDDEELTTEAGNGPEY